MAQLIPGAEGLSKRIEQAFIRFQKRLLDAGLPDPKWSIYSPEERQRRLDEAKAKAEYQNEKDLEELTDDVSHELGKMRKETEKRLRPLQNSADPIQRADGRAFEEKAQRIVRAVSSAGIEGEYLRAMDLKQTDYATELIRWAELYMDPKDYKETEPVKRLKAIHEGALELGELQTAAKVLQFRLEQLKATKGRNPFSVVSRNLTTQCILKREDPELFEMLRQSV